MLCALMHMIIPLFLYLAWWLIPWLSTLIFPTVWWLDGLGWYTSPVCRLTPILLMISIWVRCPFLPARYIHYRGFGSLLIAPWCHYSWWMCATRVMWILLELWLFVYLLSLFRFVRLVGAFRFPCTITLGSMLHDNTRDRNRLVSLRLFTFSLFCILKTKILFCQVH